MFLGHHTLAIDSKGTIALPDGYQPFLAAGLVVTAGFDGSLLVLPQMNWKVLAEQVTHTHWTDGRARTLRRHLFANAETLTLDKHGRLTLPGSLRRLAGLTDRAILVGLYNYLEIWSPSGWEQAQTTSSETAVAWEGLAI